MGDELKCITRLTCALLGITVEERRTSVRKIDFIHLHIEEEFPGSQSNE